MVLVCGPRLDVSSLDIPQGVEIRQYLPNLFEHFAASDLAIVQAGGMTTLEITALRIPFIYFPLEVHFEQQVTISGRLQRHEVGLKMSYIDSTPSMLFKAIKDNLNRPVQYKAIPIDGVRKAAKIFAQSI